MRREAILPDDTTASLSARLAPLGGTLLREELPRFFAGQLTAVPQPDAGVTLARVVDKRDGWLDFRLAARVLERRMRAFTPWPGALFAPKADTWKATRNQELKNVQPPSSDRNVAR